MSCGGVSSRAVAEKLAFARVIARWVVGPVILGSVILGAVIIAFGARAAGGEGAEKPDRQGADVSDVAKTERTVHSDWASFRGGPRLHGYRTGRVETLKLAWTYTADSAIESTAAIVGDTVYVGTLESGMLALELNPRTAEGKVAKKGKVRWRHPIEGGLRAGVGVHSGRVFAGDDFGVFTAMDAKSGKELWKFAPDDGAEILSSAAFFGENVLFGSYDGHLYCLEAKSGKLAWKLLTDGPVHATPAIADGHTFVAGCDEFVHVVDVQSGKKVRSISMGGNCAASPAVFGERLYLGTFSSRVLCVDWKKDGAEDAPGGAVLWSYEHPRRKFPYYSSPALAPWPGGPSVGSARTATPPTTPSPANVKSSGTTPARSVIVVGGRDKMVHAIDAQNGAGLWTFPTKARVDASPVVVGDKVFAAGLDGVFYLLDLRDGRKLFSFTAGSPLHSSPAVGRGRVVVSSEEGTVYCFELVAER